MYTYIHYERSFLFAMIWPFYMYMLFCLFPLWPELPDWLKTTIGSIIVPETELQSGVARGKRTGRCPSMSCLNKSLCHVGMCKNRKTPKWWFSFCSPPQHNTYPFNESKRKYHGEWTHVKDGYPKSEDR